MNSTRQDYRPLFYHRGTEWGIQLDYPHVEPVPPGTTTSAQLTFIFERPPDLQEGMPFLLREGPWVVAYGTIPTHVGCESPVRLTTEVVSPPAAWPVRIAQERGLALDLP